MKFQTIQISPRSQDAATDAEVIRLKVSGPVDPSDAVMKRAREMVLETGSTSMIESFDWALKRGSFVSEE